MKSFPLIRKKHTFTGFLKAVFTMIRNKGEIQKRTPLVIPKTNRFNEVEFKSLLGENSSKSETIDLPKTKEELITLVERFNIQGKGGAAFPMYKKLESYGKVKVKSNIFIINATECDPGLFHDRWITLNLYKEINMATTLLKELLNVDKVYIATKYELPNENWPDIEVVKMPDIYPIGAEKAIIRGVLGIEPFTYKYPVELGVLVQNIQTILTLYNALYKPENINQHFLTHKNFSTNKSYIVMTSTGSKVSEISSDSEIYVGGGIMQGEKADPDYIISASTNFIASGSVPKFKEQDCKKCGLCTSHCPLGLDVHMAAKKNMEKSEASKCVKCGSCSYICPAGIDLCSNIQDICS